MGGRELEIERDRGGEECTQLLNVAKQLNKYFNTIKLIRFSLLYYSNEL